MIEDPELRKLFKAESTDHLARLDDGLLRLEKTPADGALLEEVFRESHSLKGAARMLGLSRIESAAHGLESILNAARKGEAPLTPAVIERLNAALGDIRRLVQEALVGEVSSAAAQPAAPRATAPSASPAPPASPASSSSPPSVPLSANFAMQGAIGEPFHIETVRVETRKLDDLLTQVGELSVIQGRAQHRRALIEELQEQWAALERSRKRDAGPKARQGERNGFPARFGFLLKQTRDALYDDSARLESTVNLLEDQVRSIRLLPLSTIFTLFPRMAHDLAREQGKEAELTFEGGDITVDKRILEEMKDPLMHLIRNAIDHGIESPDERDRLGKPRCGSVRLRAARENANVQLEIRDDGRGLDPAAIRLVAKKRGLYDEGALAAMTPEQIRQMIFLPGFSTSSYVTELSGRGVGLDVVQVNVERMKGSIRLESEIGRGLTIQLRLPLSLATTRLLLASAGGRPYGLPVEFIHTSRRVRPEEIFSLEGRPTILLNGQPVIAARLADLLQLPTGKRSEAAPEVLACIVLQSGDEKLGLLVDDLLGEEEVVPKRLGAPLTRVRNVSSLAQLGNGEICAVLNPADLLRSANKTSFVLREEAHKIQSRTVKSAILLVEDSALIRAMEKRILEDAGYEVVAAVDGVEALNLLGGRSFSAVVSDIMMPNMDGLALTAHIRAETRYKDLPVVLVTALASDEDKRRGLDVGANAYIPKPSFDQRVLLDTLKRLIVT